MPAPTTGDVSSAAALLGRWLLRHGQDLHEKAVSDVEETDALRNALGHSERNISESQLYGLQNTAQANPVKALLSFVRKRGTRRRKVGKEQEADFWGALLDKIESLNQEVSTRAAEAVRARGGSNSETYDIDERARLAVTRAYVGHLVAHGRYLNGLRG